MKIKFTPLEWDLITDRPEDCIVEAHIDTHPDDPSCKWSKEELEDRVQSLYELSPGDEIDLSDPLTFSIIEDCIDGGTIMDRCNPHRSGMPPPNPTRAACHGASRSSGSSNPLCRSVHARPASTKVTARQLRACWPATWSTTRQRSSKLAMALV